MGDALEDLIRVLNIQNQEDIAKVMDANSLRRSNVMGYVVPRSELDDSCIRLIEFLTENLNLGFAGVYINHDLDTGAQVDRNSGNVVPAHWADIDHTIIGTDSFNFIQGGIDTKLVHTLRYGDQDAFGVAVFEKSSFSVQDVVLIKDAVRKFSSHINNIHEKYPLRRQVITDDLTGLNNKRKLGQDYLTYVRNWKNNGHPFGLIFGDIDYFKRINTFYGHEYGDTVLSAIGKLMREAVDDHVLLYRFGGEEFVCICPGASPEQTERYARRICDRVRAHKFPDGPDGKTAREITLCMGTASTLEEDLGDRRIISVANRRLLKAKGYNARDRVISSVRFDIDTGLASMPLFIPHLNQRIKQCNAKNDAGDYSGSVAVLNFDIVNFSRWLDNPAHDPAWEIFKPFAEWWQSQIDYFGYVAKANNRDNIVTSLFTYGSGEQLESIVREKAQTYLQKLRELPIYFKGQRVNFEFAAGGIIYDPYKVDMIPKARFLTRTAEDIVDAAAEEPGMIKIEHYTPAISAQQSQDPAFQQLDHLIL